MQPDEFPSDSQTESPPDPEPDRPFWIPDGVDFETLPAELQTAITALINPAYNQLVVSASPGLEQSTGLTIVQLLWLEILEQIEIGAGAGNAIADEAGHAEREAMIGRLLRVSGAKIRASSLLLRLREFYQRACSVGSSPRGW